MWKCEKCGSYNNGESCTFCNSPKPLEYNPNVSDNDKTVGEYTPQQAVQEEKNDTQNDYVQNISPNEYNNYNGAYPSGINNAGNSPVYENKAPYIPEEPAAYKGGSYPPTDYEAPVKKKSGNVALIIICIVLSVVLVGVIAFGAYYFLSEDDKDKTFGSIFDDDEEEIVEEEVVINEIDDSYIEDLVNANSTYTDFNIYVKNLSNEYVYEYNADTSVLASAMVQIVVLDTISDMQNDGYVDIDNDTVLFSYIPNGKEAPTSPVQDNTYLGVKSVIRDVAIYGDNNKSNLLIDYIGANSSEGNGFDAINNRLNSLGYSNTRVNRKTYIDPRLIDTSVPANTTSAHDVGCMFENMITNDGLGSKEYVLNMFKSIAVNGEKIGLKNHISPDYDSACVNAFTTQTTNNVAYVSDGETEIIVVILSNTAEGYTDLENDELRDNIQGQIVNYIIETQFEQ